MSLGILYLYPWNLYCVAPSFHGFKLTFNFYFFLVLSSLLISQTPTPNSCWRKVWKPCWQDHDEVTFSNAIRLLAVNNIEQSILGQWVHHHSSFVYKSLEFYYLEFYYLEFYYLFLFHNLRRPRRRRRRSIFFHRNRTNPGLAIGNFQFLIIEVLIWIKNYKTRML